MSSDFKEGARATVPQRSAAARIEPRAATLVVPLDNGGLIEVSQRESDSQLRVVSPNRAHTLDIEVRFEAQGPIVRVRAPSLEFDVAKNVAVRCETFQVAASEGIALHSGGNIVQQAERTASIQARDLELDATLGAIRLRANDDVQLLGENVLLNCERPQPLPDWTCAHVPAPMSSLPPQPYSGDPQLIRSILEADVADSS